MNTPPVTVTPEMIIFDEGSLEEFVCNAPVGSTHFQWFIDDVPIDTSATNFGVTLKQNGTRIQFQNISALSNGSSIFCQVVVNNNRPADHRRVLKSNESRIYIKGYYFYCAHYDI